jgi:replicative DNA helicase
VTFSLLGEISDGKSLFIGEGMATVQTVWEAFDRNISAVSVGSKSNLIKVVDAIKDKYHSLIPIILLDLYDEGAKAAAQKIKEKFAETIIIKPNFENFPYNSEKRPKDFNDLISKCDQVMNVVKEQVNEGIKQSISPQIKPAQKTEIPSSVDQSNNILEKIKQRMQSFKANGKVTLLGIETGYPKLDDVISGFQNGHLITVAARTGHGKSWVAINFLKNLAINQKVPSLFLSLEMSKEQIDYRFLSLLSEVSCKKIRDGNINDQELTQIEEAYLSITSSPLKIDENTENSTLEKLLERINIACEEGIKFILIDHIGLITDPKKSRESRVIEMAKISREIKKAAKSLQIPILVCAQLNREAEGAEGPKGSHIRESDTIKQDSDILIILHRPEKANKSDRPQEIDFIIDKNRDGEEATISFTYDSNSWLMSEKNMTLSEFKNINEKKHKTFTQEEVRKHIAKQRS